MKFKKTVLCIGSVLPIISIILVVLFCNPNIKVNNTTPAKELVTRKYDIEKELLAKAIFYVRRGFGDVKARDLASEVGFKLECKRQISDTQFYYVIVGYYRCFIIVDEKDVVQEVLNVRDFPTVEQAKEWLNRDDPDFEGYIIDTGEYEFCTLWRDITKGSVIRSFQFTLQDGVMIMQFTNKLSKAKYTFFTDEEWQQVYDKDWGQGFVILPIDKQ